MPRFFTSASNISDGIVTICGDDAVHISRSLRMRRGEPIVVCDMQKIEYNCVLEDFSPDTVTARVISSHPSDTEPPVPIHLFQALPKSDKLDTVIQKAVESGAASVTPFESERCVVRIEARKEDKKLERRQRIALEAAKQCGRGIIPAVNLPLTYDAMLKKAAESELKLFFWEGDETKPLPAVLDDFGRVPESISVVVGSEGGFSIAEARKAADCGFLLCGLGKRILRCETASGFALACLAYKYELQSDQ